MSVFYEILFSFPDPFDAFIKTSKKYLHLLKLKSADLN